MMAAGDGSEFTRASRALRLVMVGVMVLAGGAAMLAGYEWWHESSSEDVATARLLIFPAVLMMSAIPFLRARRARVVTMLVAAVALIGFFLAR